MGGFRLRALLRWKVTSEQAPIESAARVLREPRTIAQPAPNHRSFFTARHGGLRIALGLKRRESIERSLPPPLPSLFPVHPLPH